MPPPSPLHSQPLVRLLQQWVPAATGEPARKDVAERLGEWLSAFDSVKLDGALQAIASYGAQQAGKRPSGNRQAAVVDAAALAGLCRQVKNQLTALIDEALAGMAWPSGEGAAQETDTADAAEGASRADYGPFHQRYLTLQKQMDTRIGACRAQVRQALSQASPRLRQLAALDGVMAEMLGEREQKLLAAVPVYLERRFTQARETDPGLHAFRYDMRQALLAELQARLQPLLGLIEAARAEGGDTAIAAPHTRQTNEQASGASPAAITFPKA